MFYIINKETKEKYLVLESIEIGHALFFVSANLRTKDIIRISEKEMNEKFFFNGIVD